MTQYTPPEAHLLVILGEVRGDVKGIVRSQTDLSKRLDDLENRLYGRIKQVDADAQTRMGDIETRVGALESIRMKVAGFVLAMSLVAAVVGAKAGAIFKVLIGG